MLEEDGKWSRATVYEHKVNGSVVLWFGGTKYEGIGADYHWRQAHVTAHIHGRQLLDGDGSPITTRLCQPLSTKVAGDLARRPSKIPRAGNGLFTTRPFGDGEEVLHLSGDVVWLPENRQALTKASIPAPAGQMANHHKNDVNLMQIAVWVDPDPSIPGSTRRTATACMRPGPGDMWRYFNHSKHANVELFISKGRGALVGGCTTHGGQSVYLKGQGVFKTKGKVPAHTELCINYGPKYWCNHPDNEQPNASGAADDVPTACSRPLQFAAGPSGRGPHVVRPPPIGSYDQGNDALDDAPNDAPPCTRLKVQFLPFKKALLHARSLKLKSKKEWKDWAKTAVRPANVPSAPHAIYQHDGWQGYGHWLDTGTVATQDKQFLPFKQALLHARALKLKSKKEWRDWARTGVRPANMPSRPDRTYKPDGWQGYGHWLGTGNAAPKDRQFLPFKKALAYAHTLKLKNAKEWEDWAKTGVRPANVPSNPHKTYKHDGWQGHGHWLGTGTVSTTDPAGPAV